MAKNELINGKNEAKNEAINGKNEEKNGKKKKQ